ncbi:hypothetical protein PG996_003813 [Apiospora saccharicola]|uniref:Protein root UVB sensitive/RUS domain-containing protein n=1 Tax=Apiospora saccharicola TaxID=335842 RepID=A0ABR1W685_9PEZI
MEFNAETLGVVNASGETVYSYTKDQNNDALWRVVYRKKTVSKYAKDVLNIFLPAGYPHSVTQDYKPYQIYDSLQAFSSSIAGMLSSRAVLQGMGVGDAGSSATGAVLLTVFQEGTGRIATILFAHYFGQAIEPECKFYRFSADLFNDTALLLDILTPALPHYPKIMALCASGILRSLCGAAAGAAKASLSSHFAKNGNLAELNAKDGSQETVITLMGMLAGSLFVRVVEGRQAVWCWMLILIGIHLWTNYKAVRSVQMRTLNRQRASIVTHEYRKSGAILRPEQVAQRESILFWKAPPINFCQTFSQEMTVDASDLDCLRSKNYFIAGHGTGPERTIVLRGSATGGATSKDALKAYMEALGGVGGRVDLDEDQVFWNALSSAGWKLNTGALETGPAMRLVC